MPIDVKSVPEVIYAKVNYSIERLHQEDKQKISPAAVIESLCAICSSIEELIAHVDGKITRLHSRNPNPNYENMVWLRKSRDKLLKTRISLLKRSGSKSVLDVLDKVLAIQISDTRVVVSDEEHSLMERFKVILSEYLENYRAEAAASSSAVPAATSNESEGGVVVSVEQEKEKSKRETREIEAEEFNELRKQVNALKLFMESYGHISPHNTKPLIAILAAIRNTLTTFSYRELHIVKLNASQIHGATIDLVGMTEAGSIQSFQLSNLLTRITSIYAMLVTILRLSHTNATV